MLFDDSNFYLLKKSIPSLCAYRLDYTLKEVHRYFNIEITEIHAFLESLRVFKKEICIQSIEKAEWFVDMYNKIVLDIFYDPLNVIANRLMADIISYALKRHLISEHDLKLDDYQFLKRLSDLNDDFIMEQLNRLNASFEYKVVTKDEDYSIQLQTKARIIDPTVYTNHKKVLASTL